MAHSKRNTSLAFFTAHEREELKNRWGSRTSRLTRDSFLPFGSCQLCLLPARSPVACPSHGHLFCRECAIENLLAQTKELKRLQNELVRRNAEDEQERDLEEQAAQAKELADFERVQAGLSARVGPRARDVAIRRDTGKAINDQLKDTDAKGLKRKAEEHDINNAHNAKNNIVKRKSGDGDVSELPSFWVPGETPVNKKAETKEIKQQPTCPAAAADQPHNFSLKTLIDVHFRQDSVSKQTDLPKWSCPACEKVLSNATKAILGRPCGHVLCKPCSDKFQQVPLRSAHDAVHDDTIYCYVCQTDITPGRSGKHESRDGKKDKKGEKVKRGLVELSSDGTGFAGGGKAEVKKAGVVFQC